MTKKQLFEAKIRKMVKKHLNESSLSSEEHGILQKKFISFRGENEGRISSIVNCYTEWDYNNIAELVKALFIDANFHDEAEQIYDFIINLD